MTVSKKSPAIYNEMVQERWGIHSLVDMNMVEHTTQCGVRISCPNTLLMKSIHTTK